MYQGFDYDVNRWTATKIPNDPTKTTPPTQDREGFEGYWLFGSAPFGRIQHGLLRWLGANGIVRR